MNNPSNSKSYFQIIRSAGLFGGAQVINVIIGILRNKLIAVFLGTIGMGLISIFESTLDLIKSMVSLGIDTTGVREVSLASEDKDELDRTVSMIKRWALILGLVGACICIFFSRHISLWAFDNDDYTRSIAWLSISLFFNIQAMGELVILQGMRQIGYMIKSGLLWNITAFILLAPFYYYFGIQAIVPVFIMVSVITYLSIRHYRKKIDLEFVPVAFTQLIRRGKFILRIGFFIVLAAIQTQIALFLVRSMVINRVGLEQLGLLQAAWTITNVYLKLILNSMSADYYPRLSAVSFDNKKARKLINEQVNVMLIISVPIIVFLILGSKLLLTLLYSDSFESAYSLLNWRTIGIFFKVISWALGFVLLARGKGLLYFITDTSFSVIYLVCIYFFFPYYQLDAVGIAYMVAYISYFIIVYFILRKSIHFRWQNHILKSGAIFLALTLGAFYIAQFTDKNSIPLMILCLSLSVIYSLYKLNKVYNLKTLCSNIFRNDENK